MTRITFNDANDLVVSVALDNVIYKLRITWNSFGGFWTFHLWDNENNPIITNVKVVRNFPLLLNKHCFNVPRGELLVLSKSELTRDSFQDGTATFIYVTESEWYDG